MFQISGAIHVAAMAATSADFFPADSVVFSTVEPATGRFLVGTRIDMETLEENGASRVVADMFDHMNAHAQGDGIVVVFGTLDQARTVSRSISAQSRVRLMLACTESAVWELIGDDFARLTEIPITETDEFARFLAEGKGSRQSRGEVKMSVSPADKWSVDGPFQAAVVDQSIAINRQEQDPSEWAGDILGDLVSAHESGAPLSITVLAQLVAGCKFVPYRFALIARLSPETAHALIEPFRAVLPRVLPISAEPALGVAAITAWLAGRGALSNVMTEVLAEHAGDGDMWVRILQSLNSLAVPPRLVWEDIQPKLIALTVEGE